MSIEDKLFLYK